MTTIIDSQGRVKAGGDQSLVMGTYKPYNDFCGVKAYRTTNANAASGVTISWEYVAWDIGGFIASLPTPNIVIPRNGWYSVIAYINTTATAQHTGRIDININGVSFEAERVILNDATNGLMNALSVYLASRYFSAGEVITVIWDTNGTSGITLHNGGENGCSCTVWRTG
jgi:hypothetical protein